MKFKLFKGTAFFPAIAFRFCYEIGTSEYMLKGILTKRFSKVRIDLNCGYKAPGEVIEKGTIFTSAGIKWYAFERVAFVSEVAGKFKDKTNTGHVLVGAVFKLIGDFEPDIGILKALGKDTSGEWGLRVGFTVLF